MLEGSEISHNEAMYGGGVQVGAGSTLRGRSSFIGHNEAPRALLVRRSSSVEVVGFTRYMALQMRPHSGCRTRWLSCSI